MTNQEQLLLAVAYCILMLLISLLFVKYPPKKINSFYGYRTKRSMANDTIWKVANLFAAKQFVKISLYTSILPAILYFISPHNNVMITIVVHTVLLLFILYSTEKYLDKDFDKNGNLKNP